MIFSQKRKQKPLRNEHTKLFGVSCCGNPFKPVPLTLSFHGHGLDCILLNELLNFKPQTDIVVICSLAGVERLAHYFQIPTSNIVVKTDVEEVAAEEEWRPKRPAFARVEICQRNILLLLSEDGTLRVFLLIVFPHLLNWHLVLTYSTGDGSEAAEVFVFLVSGRKHFLTSGLGVFAGHQLAPKQILLERSQAGEALPGDQLVCACAASHVTIAALLYRKFGQIQTQRASHHSLQEAGIVQQQLHVFI